MISTNNKTPITSSEVEGWFQDASPDKGPWPTEVQCLAFTKGLENLRLNESIVPITFAATKNNVKEAKAESQRLKRRIAKRTKHARDFVAMLTEDIQTLHGDHQSYLKTMEQQPEAYRSENSEYLEEKNALIKVIEAIENTKDIWGYAPQRGENWRHKNAAMIADLVIEVWGQTGKPRKSLDASGPTIKVVAIALERTIGWSADGKSIETAIERFRKARSKSIT